NADQPVVAIAGGAEAAGIGVGDHVADRAVADAILDREHRRGQLLDVFARRPQQVMGEPLRAACADPRQPLERGGQLGQRVKATHQVSPGIPRPPIMPCIWLASASSTLRCASLMAATIRSWSISTSSFDTTSGSMVSERRLLWPLTATVTMPPPDEASTVISAICFCRRSCICCACCIIF